MKPGLRSIHPLFAFSSALAFASPAAAASIALTNSDFEAPNHGGWNWGSPGLAGWTPAGGSWAVSPDSYSGGSQSVVWAWSYGWFALRQDSSYTIGAAGEQITAGIYAKAGDVGSGQATIRVDLLLNGTTAAFSQVGITTSNSPWAFYSVTYTTTASDIGKVVGMAFGSDGGYQTGGTSSYTFMDNASLSVVPEPTATMLGGLGLLAMLRRRRTV